ncbi:MAG: ATP phosphoribosyltransferase regulatory subunit, partial [Rhodospirillales bacterium]
LPTLVPAVTAGGPVDGETQARLRLALDRKDAAAVEGLKGAFGAKTTAQLATMLAAAGPADETLEALGSLGLKGDAAAGRELLADVITRVRAMRPDLALTLDPVENRGFEYHTGVTFTFFAKGVRGELGNGGRYVANGDDQGTGGEPATGLTLFMDTVLKALPAPAPADRVFVPAGTPAADTDALRAEGWVAVAGLRDVADDAAEARRLGCSHVLAGGKVTALRKRRKG